MLEFVTCVTIIIDKMDKTQVKQTYEVFSNLQFVT
jgi:hypothetical protein